MDLQKALKRMEESDINRRLFEDIITSFVQLWACSMASCAFILAAVFLPFIASNWWVSLAPLIGGAVTIIQTVNTNRQLRRELNAMRRQL